MKHLLVFTCLLHLALAKGQLPIETFVLPLNITNASSPVTYAVGQRPLDTNYVFQPNSTSYEWWYFDVVSSDLRHSVVFQPVLEYASPDPLILDLSISFPNNTYTSLTIPGDQLYLTAIGQGSNGATSDGSYSWTSNLDASEYVFALDLRDQGVSGTMTMRSISPPHVSCSLAKAGASLDYHWDLFWVNLVPDSLASVNLTINGTDVSFEGSGYHDKNWSGYSFLPYLNQWYWGHGRTGDYSVVWFYRIDIDGGVSASGYVTSNDTIIFSGCGENVQVRPYGKGVAYPIPYGQQAITEGVTINIDAGAAGHFAFTTKMTQEIEVVQGLYTRWIGDFSGGKFGAPNSTGIALWEQTGPLAPSEQV